MTRLKCTALLLMISLLLVGCNSDGHSSDDNNAAQESVQVSDASEDEAAVNPSQDKPTEGVGGNQTSENETPFVEFDDQNEENIASAGTNYHENSEDSSQSSVSEFTKPNDNADNEQAADASNEEQSKQSSEEISDKPIELPFVPAT